jgi:hypothetical protein
VCTVLCVGVESWTVEWFEIARHCSSHAFGGRYRHTAVRVAHVISAVTKSVTLATFF